MDNNHQLNFANKASQYNYFRSLSKLDLGDDFTYIRQDNEIRVEANIDDIMQYNYLMYQNEAYSNKWFYAFITDMVYLNDNCTAIYFKLDTWQTWQFDLTFRKCFVEREHVNDDTIGVHTVPELLDYGPSFVCNNLYKYNFADTNDSSTVIVFQVTTASWTYNSTTITFPTPAYSIFNGIPQGCTCFGILMSSRDCGAAIHQICSYYDSTGKGDAIVAITLVPKVACEWDVVHGRDVTHCPLDLDFYVPKSSMHATAISDVIRITRPTDIDGYTPKNNKLFTSPYNYFYVSNNAGMDVTFRYEDFWVGGSYEYNAPAFEIKGSFEQGGSVYCLPLNSKSSGMGALMDGYNEGIRGITLPNLSWTSDYYLNWQAVNGKNVAIQTGLTGVSFAGGVLSGVASGAGGDYAAMGSSQGLLGFASSIANTMQQVREAQMTPPQARGNVNAGSFAFSNTECSFVFRKMTIKSEYAKLIDDYFTMYGYKVNTLKVPNITGRQNWNYVKTQDVNILGDVPQDDIAEIKSYFDRGITIWHNPTTFLDYNQNNNIV